MNSCSSSSMESCHFFWRLQKWRLLSCRVKVQFQQWYSSVRHQHLSKEYLACRISPCRPSSPLFSFSNSFFLWGRGRGGEGDGLEGRGKCMWGGRGAGGAEEGGEQRGEIKQEDLFTSPLLFFCLPSFLFLASALSLGTNYLEENIWHIQQVSKDDRDQNPVFSKYRENNHSQLDWWKEV